MNSQIFSTGIQFLLIVLTVSIFGVLYLISLVIKKMEREKERAIANAEKIVELSRANEELRRSVDSKLSEAYKTSQDQFGKTAGLMQGVTGQANKMMLEMHAQSQKVISEVSEKLAKLDETNKQVINFSGQFFGRNFEKCFAARRL